MKRACFVFAIGVIEVDLNAPAILAALEGGREKHGFTIFQ